MSQLHILHVIDSLSPGGSEKMAIEIANATDPHRYRVSICVTRNDLALKDNLQRHVGLLHLNRQRTLDWVKFNQFSNYCEQEHVDLLHIHGRYSFLLVTFLSILYPQIRRIQVVLHDHYGDVEIDPHIPLSVRIALLMRKPYYVGVHEKLTEIATQMGIAPKYARTIRNAIDFRACQAIEPVTPVWHNNYTGPFGVIVANIRASKDILFLLQGLAKITSLHWTVAIVGDLVDVPYVHVCQTLHRELGLEKRVLFLGKRLDVFNLLLQADFALLTSRTESGPLALIEYTAAGLPFVSTRVGSIGHLLALEGVPGFVEPGDISGLARAIRDLLELSQPQRCARGLYGQKIAARFFDIREVMTDWYQVYETTLRKEQ
jgi:glycosyltransferase involved in cell wall biosynthesis